MRMYEAIRDFPKQFAFQPKIENEGRLEQRGKFIVMGMGGSHLAAEILRRWNPYLNLTIHHDYGLPSLSEDVLKRSLIIVSSYSGNTEEALDAYESARKRNIAVAAISVGGKLLESAKRDGVPYIQLPDTGIQPRSALGFMAKALLALMREEQALAEIEKLSKSLNPGDYEEKGKELAEKLRGFVPVIYSSGRNAPLALNWKIKFNETGKIPAFYNVFPELNHNEMIGFDPVRALTAVSERPISNGASVSEERKRLNDPFRFIFLRDAKDHPRILKRMEVTERMFNERKLGVERAELQGESVFHKIFSSLVLADWTAYYLGEGYGVETEEVPMVEEFKKLI